MAIMFKLSSHNAQDFPPQGMQRPVHFKPAFLQLHLRSLATFLTRAVD